MSMMCRQCEQTAGGKGCAMAVGVCGKDERVAALQDLLIFSLEKIAQKVQEGGTRSAELDDFITKGLFLTITNVNFTTDGIEKYIRKAYDFYKSLGGEVDCGIGETQDALVEQGSKVGILSGDVPEDVRSLREIILYGLKGAAAYSDHARVLGKTDADNDGLFYKALAALQDDSLDGDTLTALALEVGQINLKSMEILDAANTETYGHPEPTEVKIGLKKGPAIVVTGRDLHDIAQLLEQTKGTGVNVYTHGEMLPCLAYPELKKYENFVEHFGTAWQNQQKEFDGVPAVFLFTTNCIQKPKDSYKDNVFTTGLVGWPEVKHVEGDSNDKKDFSAVIARAKELGGLAEDNITEKTLTGFGRNAVLSVADKVIEGVKSGAIKHFFLVGGCDGAKPGRNYYTDFAEKAPKDTVILTLACGKFRFNALDLGDIGGIPRLLDVGQCNDAYSAVQIAVALANAFDCGVNELPLSFILSWYEQKAVAILLTLFSLGIKNIKLGPTLPAFVSPNVLNVLVEKFNIAPIAENAEDDLKETLR